MWGVAFGKKILAGSGLHISTRSYLTVSVYKVVLQKSFPAKIRQLLLYISNNKG